MFDKKIRITLVNCDTESMFLSFLVAPTNKVWYLTMLFIILDIIVHHNYGFLASLITTVLWQGAGILLILNIVFTAIGLVGRDIEKAVEKNSK